MKATGVSRQVDQLGRIVVPKELRKTLGINVNDPIAIFVDENQIIFCKHNAGCLFCGEFHDAMRYFNGHQVCSSCVNEMTEILARSQVASTAHL